MVSQSRQQAAVWTGSKEERAPLLSPSVSLLLLLSGGLLNERFILQVVRPRTAAPPLPPRRDVSNRGSSQTPGTRGSTLPGQSRPHPSHAGRTCQPAAARPPLPQPRSIWPDHPRNEHTKPPPTSSTCLLGSGNPRPGSASHWESLLDPLLVSWLLYSEHKRARDRHFGDFAPEQPQSTALLADFAEVLLVKRRDPSCGHTPPGAAPAFFRKSAVSVQHPVTQVGFPPAQPICHFPSLLEQRVVTITPDFFSHRRIRNPPPLPSRVH